MSDSEKEYNQRRRDKFHGERSESTTKYHHPERFVHSREERSDYTRSRPHDSRGLVRNHSHSPSFEQPAKRPKYNNNYKSANYSNRYQQSSYDQRRSVVRPLRQASVVMPFKTFILKQDDRISETEAIANYNEYKLKFQSKQIEDFFVDHKNEEWFRSKYHPEDSEKCKEEQFNALKRRVDVFLELLNANKIDGLNVDSNNTNRLLQFLDTVALKLEGGTEEDIAALEKEYLKLENKKQNSEYKSEEESGDGKSPEKLAETNIEKIEVDETLRKSEITQEGLPQQDDKMENEGNEKIEEIKEVKMEKHKTSSICLRHLSSTIARKEIDSICSKYDGFLRVSVSDPQPENNWTCQGWVTFTRNSNVNEVCASLNKLRLRDCELDAVVNQDISNRICLVDGITADKEVVKSDIRMSIKIVLHLDKQAGLWLDNDDENKRKEETFRFLSSNPVLRNVSDYLVEEASAEEDELLGLKQTSENTDETNLERDDNLIAVLDKIILYLRIVHSFDYYNRCKYPNEDEMPNRCEILHVRGPLPPNKSNISQFLGKEVETNLAQFLPEKVNADKNENLNKLVNLTLKDFDKEVDKFVLNNTKELGQDKWQCPLSGKKFKGPDFIRKHIFLKYCDKIEEVKRDVEFFNNYVRDPKLLDTMKPVKEGSFSPSRSNHQGFSRNYYPKLSQVTQVRGNREVVQYTDLDSANDFLDNF